MMEPLKGGHSVTTIPMRGRKKKKKEHKSYLLSRPCEIVSYKVIRLRSRGRGKRQAKRDELLIRWSTLFKSTVAQHGDYCS